MIFKGGRMEGEVSPPASKSHSHRAFFLSSMAEGTSRISNPLMSDDILSTIAACRAMGAEIQVGEPSVVNGGALRAPKGVIDTGNSGTTMRIMTGLCGMFDEEIELTGDASIRKRPMGPLLEALSSEGASCGSDSGRPPVKVKGPCHGGQVHISGGVSSQFITSLMMLSPMLKEDSTITIEGEMLSTPYLDVTAHMMGLFGADVTRDGNVVEVKGGTGYRPYDYRVPADFSSAAFPLAAGVLGGKVTVTGMDMEDPQGDKAIVDILRRAGADIEDDGDRITARKSELHGMEVDMGLVPDLFPIVATVLSTAKGDSRLYGAPQLRFKESDRIASVTAMINGLGGSAEPTDDGCVIHGVDSLDGGTIDNRSDHRIMMSAAVASLVCRKGVTMDDVECCAISYPGFVEQFRNMGMATEVLRCTGSETP